MSLIEKRYAEAFIDISIHRGMLESYQEELEGVVELYNTHTDLKFLLLNPEIKVVAKKEIVERLFKSQIKPDLINFLLLLIDKGRIGFLPQILKEFKILADEYKNILDMTIISAGPLSEKQINGIKEKYRVLYNASSIKVKVDIDTSLIGGVKVKIGDKVIDGTVKGRLESLRQLIVG